MTTGLSPPSGISSQHAGDDAADDEFSPFGVFDFDLCPQKPRHRKNIDPHLQQALGKKVSWPLQNYIRVLGDFVRGALTKHNSQRSPILHPFTPCELIVRVTPRSTPSLKTSVDSGPTLSSPAKT